jgi:hypothetical protein
VSRSVTRQREQTNPRCAEWQDGLDSSLSYFFLNHPHRAYARYLSTSLTSINMNFCSITVVDETRRVKEHRRFWKTHTAKKETEDDGMRTRVIYYF